MCSVTQLVSNKWNFLFLLLHYVPVCVQCPSTPGDDNGHLIFESLKGKRSDRYFLSSGGFHLLKALLQSPVSDFKKGFFLHPTFLVYHQRERGREKKKNYDDGHSGSPDARNSIHMKYNERHRNHLIKSSFVIR